MSYEDYERRAEARDEAPPGLEGTSASEWADWAAHGGTTPAQNAIAAKVNGITEARNAALGELVAVASEEQQAEEFVQAPDWETESYYEPEEPPVLDPYSPSFATDVENYTAEQVQAALEPYGGNPEIEAFWVDYQQRQQAWREDAAQAQWQENENLLNAAGQQAASQYDSKQAFQSGKIRESMSEGYQVLRGGLMENGATAAEADQAIMEHYGTAENLADHLAEASAIAERQQAISSRIFNGPGWRKN
jgi:hypothetical protein